MNRQQVVLMRHIHRQIEVDLVDINAENDNSITQVVRACRYKCERVQVITDNNNLTT